MKIIKQLIFVALIVGGIPSLKAQTEDDNVIITKCFESYTFKEEKGSVVVKEKKETFYECTKRGTSIPIIEFYDNETTLDKVGGKRKSTPEYSLYTTNDMFYTDMKVCYFDLYFDRKGSTGEVKFEKTHKEPRYFSIVGLSDSEFIKEKTVQVIVPEWMNLEIVEHNFRDNVKKELRMDSKGKTKTYTYTITNEPAMKSESSMRGYSFIYPHIQVVSKSAVLNGSKITFFETLDDQYAWYHHLVQEVNNDKKIIATKAQEIVQNCKTDEEKVKALFAWVQDNIRYLAFSDGMAGFKPDDAQEVLRKKYGDCKGMANLLKAFLEAEGFDARLAWLGTNHIAYDYTIPSLSVDNHMICALNFNDRFYYLDPTVKYMPLGEYPQTIQGRQTLIEDSDRSKYLLKRIPTFSSNLNADSLYCEYAIIEDKLVGKAHQSYKGESKQVLLSLMEGTPKDKLNPTLKLFLEKNHALNEVTDLTLQGATSQSPQVEMLYAISNGSGIQTLGDEYYIDVDLTKELMNSDIDIEKRIHDIAFDYRYHYVQDIVLHIPEGYEVSYLPKELKIENPVYTFSIQYDYQEGKVIYKKRLTFLDNILLKSDFKTWNENISELKKAYMEQIVLKKQ
ncbi:MAG: transglutaminase domain-containing protein [Bacteroidales bacterium]|nr:transglutaminase domain-containing protein [Bacteroidales bacterium]